MKRLLFLLLMLFILSACSTFAFSAQRIFDQLAAVETPEEEAAVFRAIWQNAEELSFSVYAENGKTLSVSSPDFPAQLHTIDLLVNGETYRHTLIEPENIEILMWE